MGTFLSTPVDGQAGGGQLAHPTLMINRYNAQVSLGLKACLEDKRGSREFV